MNTNSPAKVVPANSSTRCKYRKFDQKEKLRCRFCRGDNCIRCGKDAYKQCTDSAISSFHCNWIFDSVMAMQRPSDELFDTIMLIEAFQCNGITAVSSLTYSPTNACMHYLIAPMSHILLYFLGYKPL
jgi:hypothetical protein